MELLGYSGEIFVVRFDFIGNLIVFGLMDRIVCM